MAPDAKRSVTASDGDSLHRREGGLWSSLPTEVLQVALSYCDLNTIKAARRVCRGWRPAQAHLQPNVPLHLHINNVTPAHKASATPSEDERTAPAATSAASPGATPATSSQATSSVAPQIRHPDEDADPKQSGTVAGAGPKGPVELLAWLSQSFGGQLEVEGTLVLTLVSTVTDAPPVQRTQASRLGEFWQAVRRLWSPLGNHLAPQPRQQQQQQGGQGTRSRASAGAALTAAASQDAGARKGCAHARDDGGGERGRNGGGGLEDGGGGCRVGGSHSPSACGPSGGGGGGGGSPSGDGRVSSSRRAAAAPLPLRAALNHLAITRQQRLRIQHAAASPTAGLPSAAPLSAPPTSSTSPPHASSRGGESGATGTSCGSKVRTASAGLGTGTAGAGAGVCCPLQLGLLDLHHPPFATASTTATLGSRAAAAAAAGSGGGGSDGCTAPGRSHCCCCCCYASVHLTAPGLAAVTGLRDLRSLELSGVSFGPRLLLRLASLPHLTQLCADMPIPANATTLLGGLRNLRSLHFTVRWPTAVAAAYAAAASADGGSTGAAASVPGAAVAAKDVPGAAVAAKDAHSSDRDEGALNGGGIGGGGGGSGISKDEDHGGGGDVKEASGDDDDSDTGNESGDEINGGDDGGEGSSGDDDDDGDTFGPDPFAARAVDSPLTMEHLLPCLASLAALPSLTDLRLQVSCCQMARTVLPPPELLEAARRSCPRLRRFGFRVLSEWQSAPKTLYNWVAAATSDHSLQGIQGDVAGPDQGIFNWQQLEWSLSGCPAAASGGMEGADVVVGIRTSASSWLGSCMGTSAALDAVAAALPGCRLAALAVEDAYGMRHGPEEVGELSLRALEAVSELRCLALRNIQRPPRPRQRGALALASPPGSGGGGGGGSSRDCLRQLLCLPSLTSLAFQTTCATWLDDVLPRGPSEPALLPEALQLHQWEQPGQPPQQHHNLVQQRRRVQELQQQPQQPVLMSPHLPPRWRQQQLQHLDLHVRDLGAWRLVDEPEDEDDGAHLEGPGGPAGGNTRGAGTGPWPLMATAPQLLRRLANLDALRSLSLDMPATLPVCWLPRGLQHLSLTHVTLLLPPPPPLSSPSLVGPHSEDLAATAGLAAGGDGGGVGPSGRTTQQCRRRQRGVRREAAPAPPAAASVGSGGGGGDSDDGGDSGVGENGSGGGGDDDDDDGVEEDRQAGAARWDAGQAAAADAAGGEAGDRRLVDRGGGVGGKRRRRTTGGSCSGGGEDSGGDDADSAGVAVGPDDVEDAEDVNGGTDRRTLVFAVPGSPNGAGDGNVALPDGTRGDGGVTIAAASAAAAPAASLPPPIQLLPHLTTLSASSCTLPPLSALLSAAGCTALAELALCACRTPRHKDGLATLASDLGALASRCGASLRTLRVTRPEGPLDVCGVQAGAGAGVGTGAGAEGVRLLCGALPRLPRLQALCWEVSGVEQQDQLLGCLGALSELRELVVCDHVGPAGHEHLRALAGLRCLVHLLPSRSPQLLSAGGVGPSCPKWMRQLAPHLPLCVMKAVSRADPGPDPGPVAPCRAPYD